MRQWDALAEAYIQEYEARGIHPATIGNAHRELLRWGSWMKRRRPKPQLEDIGPELLTRYIQERTPFKSKATVYSLISRMRCFGEYLVREGVWTENPLKWMHGPKLTPVDIRESPQRVYSTRDASPTAHHRRLPFNTLGSRSFPRRVAEATRVFQRVNRGRCHCSRSLRPGRRIAGAQPP